MRTQEKFCFRTERRRKEKERDEYGREKEGLYQWPGSCAG